MNFDEFKKEYQKIPVTEYLELSRPAPLVSVLVQTYQHAQYIGECLESILSQKTNFSFEILLGEDSSNDGTREICIRYANKYPDRIKLFLHERENNFSINGRPSGRFNFTYNLLSAQGKYIALCEGDDYWTDPNKLQKQVVFLENNPEYVLSCHPVRYWNEEEQLFKYPDMAFDKEYDTYTVGDLLKGNFITTCSVVFRNDFELPSWFTQLPVGDWPLYIILCGFSKGKIHHLSQYMATYRIHAGGIFSLDSKINQVKRLIDTCDILLEQSSFLDSNQQYLLRKLEAAYHLQMLSTIHTKSVDRKTRLMWFCKTMKRIKYFSPTELRYALVFLFDTLVNRK